MKILHQKCYIRFTMGFVFCLMLGIALSWLPGCKRDSPASGTKGDSLSGNLIIYHAGSLAVPFRKLGDEFTRIHPAVGVVYEVAGSRECARKLCDLGKECDVLAVADGKVIKNLLMPDYVAWYIEFATNEMVLVCRRELYDGLTVENLPERLLRTDALGRPDPDLDPCGYRTLMVWQLMENYYHLDGFYRKMLQICPADKVRPKETDLLALLESGQLDYFFIYRSVARQHHLKYLELPGEVNLSRPELAAKYAVASVYVSGKTIGSRILRRGEPIVYGITIPDDAPHPGLAESFVRFVLGPQGRKILGEAGHGILQNPVPAQSTRARALISAPQSVSYNP